MTTKGQLKQDLYDAREANQYLLDKLEVLQQKYDGVQVEWKRILDRLTGANVMQHEIKAKVAELIALTHPQQKVAILSLDIREERTQ